MTTRIRTTKHWSAWAIEWRAGKLRELLGRHWFARVPHVLLLRALVACVGGRNAEAVRELGGRELGSESDVVLAGTEAQS
jgi:hypothetical protein